jgi:hypothetical protein
MHDTQAMIYGWRRRLRFPIELQADIVEQCGFDDFGQRLGRLFEPAGEVQQVIGVSS